MALRTLPTLRNLFVLCLLCLPGPAGAQLLEFMEAELRAILRHGPWPQPVLPDPSNRVAGDPAAIAFGEFAFLSKRLSGSGATACARCHDPDKAWTDAPRRSWLGERGAEPPRGDPRRNTPSLWNAGLGRWFGWGGGSDSLWAFSIRPLEHPVEMGGGAAQVARLVREDPDFACHYARVFGAPSGDDRAVLVNVAKAIGAFVATLVSARTPFDEFRDALARGDRAAAARYPLDAQRGLRIFVGRGNCSVCHFGPAFTHGEFADAAVPYFIAGGGVDSGRYAGIQRLRADPHNLLGRYNDDASGRSAAKTRHVLLQQRNFGEFKVPGLRNVAKTAPYMHDGSLETLEDVVRHYSELNEDRLHADGEKILRPLRLSAAESADLVAFLRSLSDAARYEVGSTFTPVPSSCAAPRAR